MTERASLTGKVLDKYELLDKVGEGGMAEVYRGRHLTLGREVAVKVLHPHLSSTERNRLRFEREARAIVSLEHDHILRIFDYSGKESQLCYIVTEFIEGSTLKELLGNDGRLPSEVAAMVGLELCDALTFAHTHGIIHRDIKPENVMVRRDGVVKLMDFGIARVLDDSTTTLTGGLVGSPAYMSPEQASDKDVDIRSDIFSMGTLLYRAVTGHLPFVGRSTPVILRNIIEGNFADPQDIEPGLDPGLADIIRRTLSVDPDQRFATAAALGVALREVLERADLEPGAAQIRRYLEDPVAYEEWLGGHLSRVLTDQGRRLIERGDTVSAMKLLNRVLYLDENNETVKELVQGLHQPRRPISRYLLSALMVLCLPLGATLALGLAYRESIWPSAPQTPVPITARIAPPEAVADPTELTPTPLPPLPSPPPTFTEPRQLPSQNLPIASTSPGGREAPVRKPPAATPRPDRAASRETPREPQSLGATTPATLHLIVDPYARVRINKKDYGDSPPTSLITLPPGQYVVELENPFRKTERREITLSPGEIRQLVVNLKLLPARVFLKNFDPGTQLLLDGKSLGLAWSVEQPLLITRPEEEHRLVAVMADGTRREWVLEKLPPAADFTVDAQSPR